MDIDPNAPVITRDEILIDAPPEVVWNTQTDISAWPQWQPEVDAARLDGVLAVGSVFHWQTAGLRITSTIQELDPPRRIVWSGPAQGVTAIHVWELTPTDHGVLVHTEESWEGEAVRAQTATLQQALDASLRAWLINLKRAAEQDALREAVRQVLPGVRADLEALIKIPSVSADPGAGAAVRRSAEMTAALFREVGAPEVEILDGVEGGQPAVLARYPAPPGKPTVLLYAHHDVQPTGDPGTWVSPPFEPSERDGRLYGRGAADDKAGVAAHLAVLRAYGGQPPVGVTVFVEGEEEIGSPTLGAFLERYRDKLAADVIVLADSANFEVGTPALTTTLRGLADCVVEVRALEHGVHSGVYGGAAPDALTALCRLLASLHDEQGNVAVEGLVTAKPPDIDYPEERFRAEAALLDGVELLGSGSIAERIWAKPSASVLAIDTTRVADASNTLIPAARAKVSMRLAPGDDALRARQALARHLREQAPWGVRVNVVEGEAGQPFAVDAQGSAFDAARAAFRDAYGRDAVDIGVGGSIPFVAQFADAFPAAAILVTSAGADPDCRAHGPDESLHLGDFERACLAEALLLAKLAGS